MNKFFVLALFIAGMMFATHEARAATYSAGDLIKASGPAVYYYSQNGKRFVFPTEKTYKTWYTDFSSVKTISDADLAAISLGGNVTYRPGVRLVKVTTDPRVYAVSTNGVLRHINSEPVAATLYGADWNTKVDDLPDAFFVNYNLGSDINLATDFTPSTVTALATSIDVDKKAVPTPCTTNCTPTPTSTASATSTLNFSISKLTASPGDILTLTATAVDPVGIKLIKLLFDNTLIQTCSNTQSCTGQAQVPVVTNKSVYEARAISTSLKDDLEKTSVLNVNISNTSQTGHVTMILDSASIKSGQTTGATLQTDNTIAVKRMDIYVNDQDVKVCETGIRLCQWTQTYTGSIGTTFKLHGIVQDTLGRTYRSPDYQITIVANDTPAITFISGKSTLNTGETVDMTVTASDENGIKYLEVLDKDKALLKHCDGAAACTYVTGPLSVGTHIFYAKASDVLDAIGETFLQVTAN